MRRIKCRMLTTIADEKKFSGVISIEEDNKIIFQYINGMENKEHRVSITRHTLFAIASGTKFLTALAIGKLVDSKQLDLNSKAKDIFDLKIESIDQNITIQQLLTHTSGMSDYLDEDLIDETQPIYFDVPFNALINPKDFIPIFSKDPQKFRPGTQFNYNNQAFIYLAIIVEEVSKKAYIDFINEDLLKPIGIIRSGIYHLDRFPTHTALGYLNSDENGPSNIGLLPYQAGGDGGAIFSVDEMRILWESFFDYQIISKELVDEFIYPHAVVDEETNHFYGLGLWLKKDDDGILPYLMGGDPGISFTSSYNPLTKKYKVAVSNTSQGVWDIFNAFKIL